jgi:hypothetical protein
MSQSKRSTKTEAGAPVFTADEAAVLAGELRKLRELNEQYDRGIAALIAARRIANGWDAPTAPDMPLSARREVVELTGTADELAAFDAAHGVAMRAEQEAAVQAQRKLSTAPARVAALESHLKALAKRMTAEVDTAAINAECEQLFAPSARRLLEAAKVFADAWCDMRAVAGALSSVSAIAETNVYGESFTQHRFDPIGRRVEGELVPGRIAGIPSDELAALNLRLGQFGSAAYEAARDALRTAGIEGKPLTLYRPGSATDERKVYAEDSNPPVRTPEGGRLRGHYAPPAYVAGIQVQALPSAPPATTISLNTLSQG